MAISSQVSPASLLEISLFNYQRALVVASEIIINQLRKNSRSEMVAVHMTLRAIPPRSIYSKSRGRTRNNLLMIRSTTCAVRTQSTFICKASKT
jgi:hypothetical protein